MTSFSEASPIAIKKAVIFYWPIVARDIGDRIIELRLDSEGITKRIIEVYIKVLQE